MSNNAEATAPQRFKVTLESTVWKRATFIVWTASGSEAERQAQRYASEHQDSIEWTVSLDMEPVEAVEAEPWTGPPPRNVFGQEPCADDAQVLVLGDEHAAGARKFRVEIEARSWRTTEGEVTACDRDEACLIGELRALPDPWLLEWRISPDLENPEVADTVYVGPVAAPRGAALPGLGGW